MILALIAGISMLLNSALSTADVMWLTDGRIQLAAQATAVSVVLSVVAAGAGGADILSHPTSLDNIAYIAMIYVGTLIGTLSGQKITNSLNKHHAAKKGLTAYPVRAEGFKLTPFSTSSTLWRKVDQDNRP